MRIAIIPCYKTTSSALEVAQRCALYCDLVICVDDACPYNTGSYIDSHKSASNIVVIYSSVNRGVGGAFKLGLKHAVDLGGSIFIKVDSDGQMDPALIPHLVERIEAYGADVSKGNRFTDRSITRQMPLVRLIGNMGLSFITKISTGYWELFDPTNGFLCLSRDAVCSIGIDKTSDRYFFETDILFRAGLQDMVIDEVSMPALYGDEISSLSPSRELINFSRRHLIIGLKRIVYQYFIFDFSPGTISLILSLLFLGVAFLVGLVRIYIGIIYGELTPSGTLTVFLALFIAGNQYLIGFFQYDSYQRVLMRQLKRQRRRLHST